MAETFEPLQNRLRKNRRHLGRQAQRLGISCYRLYDRDMPEYPFAIDWYDGQAHLQLFHGRRVVTFDWDLLQHKLAEALSIAPRDVIIKVRQRQKGRNQYRPTGLRRDPRVITENGLKFEIDLHAHLDTGLFLDHRQTRQLVRQEAAGRRMLNLFAYTGTFSVYAAAGGAPSTLSVDLSNTYQQWTARNLRLNGLDETRNRLERTDVLVWLRQAVRRLRLFDLIVLDPPSFSNSSAMQHTLDIQRDHGELIDLCLELLPPGGILYFSTNRRGFRLDDRWQGLAECTEITFKTVPFDFQRIRPHRCWRMVR